MCKLGSVDLHPPAKLLVLVADELDELGVRHDLLVDADREWLRVRLRIVDRDVDFEPPERGPAEALCELGLLAVRTAADVEPAVARTVFGAAQVVRLDDERVALPMADGIAVPLRLRVALFRQRAAVDVNLAEAVVGFVQHQKLCRRLDDLARLGLLVELRDTHGQAVRVWILLAVERHPLLLQFGGPRCHGQAVRHVGAEVTERRNGWCARRRWRRWRRVRTAPASAAVALRARPEA